MTKGLGPAYLKDLCSPILSTRPSVWLTRYPLCSFLLAPPPSRECLLGGRPLDLEWPHPLCTPVPSKDPIPDFITDQ